jgi:predicted O-methyltransferase YrrM
LPSGNYTLICVGHRSVPLLAFVEFQPPWVCRESIARIMLAGMGEANDDGALWNAVDAYLADHLIARDNVLEAALRDSEAAQLPPIQVTALQGKLLQMFARMVGARRILEVGTLGGYSTIWLARALPENGQLVTLEAAAKHAAVARKNLERAGLLGKKVELREGPALDTLPKLAAEGAGPFDLIFLDADKEHNAEYLQWAVRLSRVGTVIVTDNVVREGAVLDAASEDPMVKGTRRFFEALAAQSQVAATAIQTVSGKKYDGFALLIVDRPSGS